MERKSSPSSFFAQGQGTQVISEREEGGWGGGGASSLPDLHVVGREKAVGASAHAAPPAFIDHLDVGDDVVGVEGDLVVAG